MWCYLIIETAEKDSERQTESNSNRQRPTPRPNITHSLAEWTHSTSVKRTDIQGQKDRSESLLTIY